MRARAQRGYSDRTGNTVHGEAQRSALVRAAYGLIAEKGFEGLRTRDVAQRASVNIATLHYYFATKEDLIRGVVGLMRDIFSGKHPSGDFSEQEDPLLTFREDLADLPHQWRMEPQLYIVLVELYLRSLRDPAIRRIMSEMEADWTEHLTGYLARGVAQGVFRQDLDITLLATMLRTAIKGMILEILTYEEAFPAERIFIEIERWLGQHARP
ncbi:MAG: TetR family transcriptional regulator [Ktedonobacterales bacterium]|nr:TetR family transcriptional regulator [Ktedonobacterales bacterium]